MKILFLFLFNTTAKRKNIQITVTIYMDGMLPSWNVFLPDNYVLLFRFLFNDTLILDPNSTC